MKFLHKAEGLRAAIVQHAFKLKLRGIPTPARLRAQLAKLALSRAFANTLPEASEGRSGLSAKAGRNLAGRLAHPPRDFATDSRLISALAIESAGATKGDLESLQTALLRRYVTRGQIAAQPGAAKPDRRSKRIAAPKAVVARAAYPVAQLSIVPANGKASAQSPQRADFTNFVTSVRHLAEGLAEGWPGNRKAYVSKVWTAVQAQYPAWPVSEIEFKAMLAEAHRLGHIVLANADLKDQRSMVEIQASAIAYKNAIFHYVRVDD